MARVLQSDLLVSGNSMHAEQAWFVSGKRLRTPQDQSLPEREEKELLLAGAVRLTVGRRGTELRWRSDTPCFASLYAALFSLEDCRPPFVLRFWLQGWLEEWFDNCVSAQRRIEDVISRGDRYLPTRVFVKKLQTEEVNLPSLLNRVLRENRPPPEYTVTCSFRPDTSQYVVERVGSKSLVGRIWGCFTTSHPCRSDGSYSEAISEAYDEVLTNGKPRYDQVLAALPFPGSDVHWLPYHRLIFPQFGGQAAGVAVVSQPGKVEIDLL